MHLSWLSTDLACWKIWTPSIVLHKLNVVAYNYTISTGKEDAGGSEVLVHPWIHNNLRTIWDSWGPDLNTETNKQKQQTNKPTITEASLMPISEPILGYTLESSSYSTEFWPMIAQSHFFECGTDAAFFNLHEELCNGISMCSKAIWMARR